MPLCPHCKAVLPPTNEAWIRADEREKMFRFLEAVTIDFPLGVEMQGAFGRTWTEEHKLKIKIPVAKLRAVYNLRSTVPASE